MPKAVERKLFRSAHKKGYKGDRAKRYVYSTMNKLGLMPGSKKKQS